MTKIIMTCGNIGTGKSTTAKEILSTLKAGEYFVWSVDSIAQALSSGIYDVSIWTAKHKEVYDNLKAQLVASSNKIKNLTIILDDCHMSRQERKKWVDLAKSMKYSIHLIVHKASNNVDNRMIADDRGYIKDTWNKISDMFASEWDEPSEQEGFDSITMKQI